MQRRVVSRHVSPGAAAPAPSRRALLVAVGGLMLAGVLLVVFHATVTGAVRKAETTQLQYRLAAHPEPVCRGAGTGTGPDLCMLHAAVPAKLVHAARVHLRRPSGGLQARAD